MALTDSQLLTSCANFTLHHTAQAEDEIIKELQTSSATRLVMGLRICRLQRAILAVGMFSMFEALLQSKLNWSNPFVELDTYLRKHHKPDLAAAFNDYRLAINVLKHGEGRSHTELLSRADSLEFKVRDPAEDFHEEGDVSDVGILVDVSSAFVLRCAKLIEEAAAIIETHDKVWL